MMVKFDVVAFLRVIYLATGISLFGFWSRYVSWVVFNNHLNRQLK